MARRRPCLESRILAAFQQALAEGCLDVAEHLLCALEALDPGGTPGPALSEAFLSLAESGPRH
ncbi:MAG: hypothetical protein IRY87_35170 [Acetobacteraceae bacterium]|nr:hypothetical protein [Acetobacteraceae bacterium]